MKFAPYILSLAVFLGLASCSKNPFPAGSRTAHAGDLTVKSGAYLGYDADYGMLAVPENRSDADARLIELPVIRVRSRSLEPGAPVFVLGGGPGAPNVYGEDIIREAGNSESLLRAFLENHDVVMVGYRGADGSVTLSAPEFRSTLSRVRRPLSERGIETLASALDRDLQNAGERGVDIAGYNLVEVAADVEAARSKLGYETIDLYSVSYGGQVAYTYCLEYPERVGRNVMVCADAPGHLAIRDCATVDSLLAHYGKLWSREPEFTRRCEDLVACVKTVLDALERRGQPDPDKVKIMTVTMLYSTSSAAYVFDAYLDAYDGNYEKLSRLSTAFDYGMHRAALWGDFYLKLYSMGEIDPDDEHSEPLKSRSCIMGSPLFELFFGPARLLKSRVPAVPKQLREGQFCNVSTLFVSGSLDFSGPAENVRKFLLPYFGNGRLVVLSEFGHSDVPGTVQPEAFYHLVMTFLNDGTVDDSQYEYAPVEFEPSTSFEAWLRGER